jgi:hypothetical protein
MTRNLKALGLALLSICAMGAVMAQGASATEVKHQFHSDGLETIITGINVGKDKFQVGSAGTVECGKTQTEATQTAEKEVSSGTFESDTLTVIPHYSECTFGGQPATVTFNHCAYVFDSDTTDGNPDGSLHANVEIECSGGSEIEVDTSLCTITIAAQTVKHAVRYEKDLLNEGSASLVQTTAKKVKTGKKTTTPGVQTGCLLFPTGEIGTYTGTSTTECFKDESASTLKETAATTPTGTKEGATTACTVTNTV